MIARRLVQGAVVRLVLAAVCAWVIFASDRASDHDLKLNIAPAPSPTANQESR